MKDVDEISITSGVIEGADFWGVARVIGPSAPPKKFWDEKLFFFNFHFGTTNKLFNFLILDVKGPMTPFFTKKNAIFAMGHMIHDFGSESNEEYGTCNAPLLAAICNDHFRFRTCAQTRNL